MEKQLLLHHAVAMCEAALLRPGSLPDEDPLPIVGETYAEDLWTAITPALDEAWPGHPAPAEVDALEGFLQEAADHLLAAARALDGAEGFVPAASFSAPFRELVFEHLRVEVDLIAAAVETEGLWNAFENYEPTSALTELVETGMRIKLRAVGAFLINPPTCYEDEATAAEFFPAGEWEHLRDSQTAESILADQQIAHKQIAHLTVRRPLPEERRIYSPSTYYYHFANIMRLLNQFTDAVHPGLIPDWWAEWMKERTPPAPRGLREREQVSE